MMKTKKTTCCTANDWRVDSLVTVDERGQMLLPKDLRKQAGINPGDKLAVITCKQPDGKVCCVSLVKSEELSGMVKDLLGPMLKELV